MRTRTPWSDELADIDEVPGYFAVARESGLPAGLFALHRELADGAVPFGPGRHAVLPDAVLATADTAWHGVRAVARRRGQETTLASVVLDGERLTALRTNVAAEQVGQAAPYEEWRIGLAWVRLGCSEWLLERCLDYLDGRSSAGTPMLFKQLVSGRLAEARIAHLEIRVRLQALVLGEVGGQELNELSGLVTGADRKLLHLLGASGYRSDGPGQTAYVSELLGGTYFNHIPGSGGAR